MHVITELFNKMTLLQDMSFITVPHKKLNYKKIEINNICLRSIKNIKYTIMRSNHLDRKKFIQSDVKTIFNDLFGNNHYAIAANNDFLEGSSQAFETKSGIKIINFLEGKGKTPAWGTILKVNYVNYITFDQITRKIDSTIDRKEIFTFQHGTGEINVVLEEAIHSMKVGGKRRIIAQFNSEQDFLTSGPISPSSGVRQELRLFLKNNTRKNNLFLIYDIELLEIIEKNKL